MAMTQITMIYPATITPDEIGRLLVQFPDLPEALTDGATLSEALSEAADCLSVALAGRIIDRKPIPLPSPLTPDMVAIYPDETIALKASLHHQLQIQGLRTADLARLLNIDHKEARRLRDPKHATKLLTLTSALHALGGSVAVTVSFAAE